MVFANVGKQGTRVCPGDDQKFQLTAAVMEEMSMSTSRFFDVLTECGTCSSLDRSSWGRICGVFPRT